MSGLVALAVFASIPAAGFAQTSTTDRSKADRSTTERKKDRPAWSNTQGLHEAKDIVGTKVQNAEGKDIGKVDALLIDPKDGKVTHAVVGLGGMLGLGKDKVVVDYSALKMTGHESGRKAKIVVDQSALESAPKYVKTADRAPSASPATSPRSTSSSTPSDKPATEKK
jgi:sporulation protein YlmC with PRC-barrel domain